MAFDGISYDVASPGQLSQGDIERICAIESDMWSRNEGLGTYMYCSDCGRTFSKQDIYKGKIEACLYSKTVFEIEQRTERMYLNCSCCNGSLEAIFDQTDYIDEIIERYSSGAMLLLMREEDKIVGFMDGHISDYDTIYRRDLSYRYPQERKNEIAIAIEQTLGRELPEQMFSCSSMGTTESYMSFIHVYGLLQNFFGNFPVEHEGDVGISELNSGGSLDKIYKGLGSQSIGISPGNQNYDTDSYDSGLFVQENLGRIYKDAFSLPLKSFLRSRKSIVKKAA